MFKILNTIQDEIAIVAPDMRVTSIDSSAFYNVGCLKYLYVKPSIPPTLGSIAISTVSDMVIYVPDDFEEIDKPEELNNKNI